MMLDGRETWATANAQVRPNVENIARASLGGMRLGVLARTCQLFCELAIVALAVIVVTELVTGNLLNFSFQISDEVGGYIVVGLTFLALPVCQAGQAYHHVMLVQARLS